jgi:hypothetical protein
MDLFWNVTPCSLLQIHRRFKDLTVSIIALMMEAIRSSEGSAMAQAVSRRTLTTKTRVRSQISYSMQLEDEGWYSR